jgi:ketosteroid isomerase-like protein
VPWIPELFSAPALAHVLGEHRHDPLAAVPFFAGLMAGETPALLGSFAGEPEMHHPVRGRIRGEEAFARYAGGMSDWLTRRDVRVEPVGLVRTAHRAVEEVLLHLGGAAGGVALPVAIAVDRDDDGRLFELRVYFSTWPVTGGHAIRPPLLQGDPRVRAGDVVGEYQQALAAGDVDAIVATLEPDAVVREPAGGEHRHHGTDAVRSLFTHFFSNDGGIALEHCTVVDDGQACGLEYNLLAWGATALRPQAAVAVYVRGESGRLAAVRIYDDSDPPLTPAARAGAEPPDLG